MLFKVISIDLNKSATSKTGKPYSYVEITGTSDGKERKELIMHGELKKNADLGTKVKALEVGITYSFKKIKDGNFWKLVDILPESAEPTRSGRFGGNTPQKSGYDPIGAVIGNCVSNAVALAINKVGPGKLPTHQDLEDAFTLVYGLHQSHNTQTLPSLETTLSIPQVLDIQKDDEDLPF